MVSTCIILPAISSVPVTFTFLPSKGLAFLGSSSVYLVFVAEPLSTKFSPFVKTVPINVSASGCARV